MTTTIFIFRNDYAYSECPDKFQKIYSINLT